MALWLLVPVFLTVLPVLVNLTDWAVLSALYPGVDLRALGFSGVAAGFGGVQTKTSEITL